MLARVGPAARPGSGGDLSSLVSANTARPGRAEPPPSSRLRGLGPAARDAGTCGRARGSGRWLIVCALALLSFDREEACGAVGTLATAAALALLSGQPSPDASGLFLDVPSFTSCVLCSLVARES